MIVHPMIVASKASELMSWSVVRRACVRALTFTLNIFFSETTFDEISQKSSSHGTL